MKDLKIRVNSESESKEAQELFFELDYNWFKKGYVEVKTPETIMSFENGALSTGIRGSINHKEITLPELRDLVVLKRNSIDDATHGNAMYPYVKLSDGWYYFDKGESNKWLKSAGGQPSYYENLKPIEKPMKEYLNKETYEFVRSLSELNDMWIEIPEWADEFKANKRFYKNGDSFFNIHAMVWTRSTLKKDAYATLWQRPSTPEELPFIDDEPCVETATGYQLDVVGQNTYGSRCRNDRESDISYRQYLMNFIVDRKNGQSVNDQYAEIEKVRQSAWQKQEGGSHYKNLKIQPMQYALENKLDYAQANVVKYVTRHKEKNGKEDLLKAIHNIELMIEFYYGGGE